MWDDVFEAVGGDGKVLSQEQQRRGIEEEEE